MSSNQPAPTYPGAVTRASQATQIEQSRAIAEVQAAIFVAQQAPRNIQAAMESMRRSCAMKQLADRAFYSYSRGGANVTGASVYLARDLARCWGNITHGVSELSRDEEAGQSEVLAYAWDLETNTRVANTFIVQHIRDRSGGGRRLTDMRDIYENNANAGARRLRECIFGVLPPWFTEEAKDLCSQTIEKQDSEKPLPVRIADMLSWYAGKFGVTEEDVVRKFGRPSSKWTEHDLAQLRILGQSLSRGETTRDEEFPPPLVSADEVAAQARPSGSRRRAAPPPATDAPLSDAGEPTPEDIQAWNVEAEAAARETTDVR